MQWEEMSGDDRVRLCGGCSRQVYNLSDMTASEAEQFLSATGESHCLRFFRRSDGKIMTDNCPRGLRAIRDRVRVSVKIAAAVLTSIFSFLPVFRSQSAIAQDVKGNVAYPKNCKKQMSEITGSVPSLVEPSKSGNPPALPLTGKPAPRAMVGEAPADPPVITPKTPPANVQPPRGGTASSGNLKPAGFASGKNSPPGSKASDSKDLKDSRAYNIFVMAGESERAGKLMLAQTQYKEALKMASSQATPADPKLIRMIEDSLAKLRGRLKSPDAGLNGH